MAWFHEISNEIFITRFGHRAIRRGSALAQGTNSRPCLLNQKIKQRQECPMNQIIYIVGLVVIVVAILSFLGIA